MNDRFTVRRRDSDRNIFERAAETARHMPFKVRKDERGFVFLEVRADVVDRRLFAVRNREIEFAVRVPNVAGRDFRETVLFERFPAIFRAMAASAIGRGAFDERSFDRVDERFDEVRLQEMIAPRFAGADFHRRFAGEFDFEFLEEFERFFRRNRFCKVNDRNVLRVGGEGRPDESGSGGRFEEISTLRKRNPLNE